MQIRSRVGVASRYACFKSQTARTPVGQRGIVRGRAVPADPPATSSQTVQTILRFMHIVASRIIDRCTILLKLIYTSLRLEMSRWSPRL